MTQKKTAAPAQKDAPTAVSSSRRPRTTTASARKTARETSAPVPDQAASAPGGRNLVIVESPAKARTIEKYLGKSYRVLASVGHVMDLPKSRMGVDIEHDFKPEYVAIRGKKKVLDALKRAAADAPAIYLATDPDREGEAIAWHVARCLRLKDNKVRRATFNEITKKAVLEAIARPATIDDNLCMAQQTRRILDRLVGYQISPLLWKNVRRGLSAGRVQSVAVRLLCEREAEIEAFESQEYWTVDIDVEGETPPPFKIRLTKIDGGKAVVPNGETAQRIIEEIRDLPLVVRAVVKKPQRRNPQPPFITSSLQQEAARKNRTSPSRTMAIAQNLYEGVDIGPEGLVGLITYMRTDSTRVSAEAQSQARAFVRDRYGAKYVPAQPNVYASKKGAQDAHEAIRPTLLDRPPETLEGYLDGDQMNLYRLIWNRFIASQMAPAELERTTIEVPLLGDRYLFAANGSVVTFPGFLAVYEEDHDPGDGEQTAKEETAFRLPEVKEGETLRNHGFLPEQHFTQPPPRYSMSSLVRELEKRGIGRPSTYAAILSTIQERDYAERVKGFFRPTELGKIVTEILIDSFPEILDVAFTARMERELDEIEEGERGWLDVLRAFYAAFRTRLDAAESSMKSPRGTTQETDVECDKCGSKMVIKWGRNGHFLSCSNYPECKNAKPFSTDDEGNVVAEETPETDAVCEKCGAPMVVRRGSRGPFLACSKYPDCKTSRPIATVENGKAIPSETLPGTDEACEKCGAPMTVKRGRRGPFLACSAFPKCRNAKDIAEVKDGKALAVAPIETDEVCEKCNAPMRVRRGPRGYFLACTAYPKCKNTRPFEAKSDGKAATGALPHGPRPKPVETEEKCENCGKPMLLRSGRHGPFLGCSGYPKCKTTRKPAETTIEKRSEPQRAVD